MEAIGITAGLRPEPIGAHHAPALFACLGACRVGGAFLDMAVHGRLHSDRLAADEGDVACTTC